MYLSDAIEGFTLFRSGGQVSIETVKTEQCHLEQFLRWKGDCDVVTDIDAGDVRNYMDYQREERGLSPNTVIRIRCAISCLYTWLENIGIASKDPTDRVPAPRKPKRVPKGLSEEQIEQLVRCAGKTNNPRRDRAICLFLLDSACRNSEARKVQISDVGFSTGRVRVVGKGDKERHVFIGKRALSACFIYTKETRPEPAVVDDNTLFLSHDGYQLGRSGFRQIFTRLSEDLEFRVYPHLLRHTSLLTHLKNGLNMKSVQLLAGHSDIRTTERYVQALTTEDMGKVAVRTSPSDNLRL
jgi:site-specific recombinase XerD